MKSLGADQSARLGHRPPTVDQKQGRHFPETVCVDVNLGGSNLGCSRVSVYDYRYCYGSTGRDSHKPIFPLTLLQGVLHQASELPEEQVPRGFDRRPRPLGFSIFSAQCFRLCVNCT